MSKSQNRDS